MIKTMRCIDFPLLFEASCCSDLLFSYSLKSCIRKKIVDSTSKLSTVASLLKHGSSFLFIHCRQSSLFFVFAGWERKKGTWSLGSFATLPAHSSLSIFSHPFLMMMINSSSLHKTHLQMDDIYIFEIIFWTWAIYSLKMHKSCNSFSKPGIYYSSVVTFSCLLVWIKSKHKSGFHFFAVCFVVIKSERHPHTYYEF